MPGNTHHTREPSLYTVHLELPVKAFQPALCHPAMWDSIAHLDPSRISTLARRAILASDKVSQPYTSMMSFTEPGRLRAVSGYPVSGVCYNGPETFFPSYEVFNQGRELVNSNRFWAFWLYNAVVTSTSITSVVIANRVIGWDSAALRKAQISCAKKLLGVNSTDDVLHWVGAVSWLTGDEGLGVQVSSGYWHTPSTRQSFAFLVYSSRTASNQQSF